MGKTNRIDKKIRKLTKKLAKARLKDVAAARDRIKAGIAKRERVKIDVNKLRADTASDLGEALRLRDQLDAAWKRQRGILHVQAGDAEWQPTKKEMKALSAMFLAADQDPMGGIVVTRSGVQAQWLEPMSDIALNMDRDTNTIDFDFSKWTQSVKDFSSDWHPWSSPKTDEERVDTEQDVTQRPPINEMASDAAVVGKYQADVPVEWRDSSRLRRWAEFIETRAIEGALENTPKRFAEELRWYADRIDAITVPTTDGKKTYFTDI